MRIPRGTGVRTKVVSSWPDHGRGLIIAVCDDGSVYELHRWEAAGRGYFSPVQWDLVTGPFGPSSRKPPATATAET